jgi:hypothetical protein
MSRRRALTKLETGLTVEETLKQHEEILERLTGVVENLLSTVEDRAHSRKHEVETADERQEEIEEIPKGSKLNKWELVTAGVCFSACLIWLLIGPIMFPRSETQ